MSHCIAHSPIQTIVQLKLKEWLEWHCVAYILEVPFLHSFLFSCLSSRTFLASLVFQFVPSFLPSYHLLMEALLTFHCVSVAI